MNTAIINGQNTNLLNRREFISYCFLACLVLLGVATLAMVIRFAMPQQPTYEVYVGKLSDFPAYATPHEFHHDERHPYYNHKYFSFYVVNTGSEVVAFDRHSTHYYSKHCWVDWKDVTYRYEDPCSGSKFEIDGIYISGPADRSLDRFPVRIENGEIWVDTSKLIFGAEVCYDSPEICTQQNKVYER